MLNIGLRTAIPSTYCRQFPHNCLIAPEYMCYIDADKAAGKAGDAGIKEGDGQNGNRAQLIDVGRMLHSAHRQCLATIVHGLCVIESRIIVPVALERASAPAPLIKTRANAS